MELVGIENENGYFPEGFFAESLAAEIAEPTARWAEELREASPVERLAQVAPAYLSELERSRGTGDALTAKEARTRAAYQLVETLGYPYHRQTLDLDTDTLVPVLARVADPDGRDLVWILEAPKAPKGDEAADPLSLKLSREQFPDEEREHAETEMSIEEILGVGIFTLKRPPKYVLVLGLNQIVLARRDKWPSRSVLRFDLVEIFDRRDRGTLAAMACFASREAIAPETGIPLVDRLEEEAQRRANAVTSSLKRTVRDAIEILGQEVLDVTGGKYPRGHERAGVWMDGAELSRECLRYMYRLLFLFYAEANPRLGVLDMKNPVYSSGYSLEALRAIESRRLIGHREREGTFLWESLQKLLELMYHGTEGVAHEKGFRLKGAKVQLLDPRATPILSNVELRNEAMQRIIRLLSLKTGKGGTGRISYAQLGIGQLGAVYETLISFTGFVAKDDLIEIRPGKGGDEDSEDKDASAEDDAEEGAEEAGGLEGEAEEGPSVSRTDKIDPLAPAYFVPRTRAKEFSSEQIVYDGPLPRIYPKGAFIYRLAGRDREKSASYYTPEPLARLLVKHMLQERCADLKADELLGLKILEPAMGSAAFLVETVNQLADLYLERKQEETGQTIPQENYFQERQKVRAYISDRNCFGVDLNPIAVELGSISLWLNSLHDGTFSPWFGDQIQAGNSLIGARRAAYPPATLVAKKADELWLKTLPQEIGWKAKRPEGHVWQFLLPADGMAKFEGEKSIRAFAGGAQEAIKAWRKAGWEKALTPDEVKLVQKLSKVADDLFEAVADDLRKAREACNDTITLWPDKVMPGVAGEDFIAKNHRLRVLRGEAHLANTVPYKRLKTAMDAWCALWLWPLDKAELLPARSQFFHDLRMILEGGYLADEEEDAPVEAQGDLFDLMGPGEAERFAKELPSGQMTMFQPTDVDSYVEDTPWLKAACEVAARERFVHYDLIFADVLRERGGFDLVVGNPPWAQVSWNEGLVLADLDPIHVGRSAKEAKDILPDALAGMPEEKRNAFLATFVSTRGAMAVTASPVMNPYAGGGANNLYRCFIDLSFRLLAPEGRAGLIHQDGHLGDPKSGAFRTHWYSRVARHFEFINRMKAKNFAEVDHNVRFSLNIYRGTPGEVEFDQCTNAFVASQIEDSYAHDGAGPVPNFKGADGAWDTRGHRDRIIQVNRATLAVIHSLSEEAGIPVEEARFIQPYSSRTLDVFRRMAHCPKLDASIPRIKRAATTATGEKIEAIPLWQMAPLWHETASQKDGTIRRKTEFYTSREMVIQGPLIHVANPLYKTPRAKSRTNADYDVIDLVSVGPDYLPRTNYGPSVDEAEFNRRSTPCRWNPAMRHADQYRIAFRSMIGLNGERSLIGALIPPGVTHINKIESAAFQDEGHLLKLHAIASSIPLDYLVKANGRGDLFSSDVGRFPFPAVASTALHRGLRLACLTNAYADLWNRHARNLEAARWSSPDPRLALEGPVEGPEAWDRTAGLRTEFARRMALVEIDVLVAQALGLTLEQLIEIYRVHFPITQQYEEATWYDQQGRIVWTRSKGLPGVGYLERGKSPGRAAWDRILADKPEKLVCTVIDDTQPGGPQPRERRFVGPFTTCDRVADYRRAWSHFESLKTLEVAAE